MPEALRSYLFERLDDVARELIAEDAPGGDLTTEALGLFGRRGRISFTAREAMTVAGTELAATMFKLRGAPVVLHRRSGERVDAGTVLLAGEGDATALHLAWKPAQILVETLSGIASAARAMVDAVEGVNPDVRVACTRKAFPGGRRLTQLAAKTGGAILHRGGLSETILVFAEHRAFLGSEPLADVVHRLKQAEPEKKITIEVKSLDDAREAIEAGFDVIQLEKFSVEEVREVAAFNHDRALIAAAGGVSAANAAEYVRAGAGLIVTSAPYSAAPKDVSVSIAAVANGQ